MSAETAGNDRGPVRSQLRTLMDWARDFRTSRLLTTAVDRAVLERFSDGPRRVDDVVRSDENVDAVRRFVRTLASVGLLETAGEKQFTPTELTEQFLLPDAEFDLRPIIQLFHQNYELWQRLPETLTEGHDVESDVFGEVEFGRDFMLAMETRAHFAKKDVARAVKPMLEDGDRLIDLGCGTGVFTREILRTVSGIEAVLADLPHVIETAREFTEGTDVADRVSFQELDFFETESYGENFDAALLFSICHMFGKDKNQTLLSRTAKCLRPGGFLILRDYVLEEGGVGPAESNFFDLHMLLATDTGRNYTREEYRELFAAAGLEYHRTLSVEGPDDLLVARKPE